MSELYLVPSKNLTVLDPDTGLALPEDGAYVRPGIYWSRRIKDGDVKISQPSKKQNSKASSRKGA